MVPLCVWASMFSIISLLKLYSLVHQIRLVCDAFLCIEKTFFFSAAYLDENLREKTHKSDIISKHFLRFHWNMTMQYSIWSCTWFIGQWNTNYKLKCKHSRIIQTENETYTCTNIPDFFFFFFFFKIFRKVIKYSAKFTIKYFGNCRAI